MCPLHWEPTIGLRSVFASPIYSIDNLISLSLDRHHSPKTNKTVKTVKNVGLLDPAILYLHCTSLFSKLPLFGGTRTGIIVHWRCKQLIQNINNNLWWCSCENRGWVNRLYGERKEKELRQGRIHKQMFISHCDWWNNKVMLKTTLKYNSINSYWSPLWV